MSFTVRCYTLFDITQTGVRNRSKPDSDDIIKWTHDRNTQCNLDTIIQAVSLRSQPEDITCPELIKIKFDDFTNFGFLFEQQQDEEYNCWTFDFKVHHPSVYYDGINELGSLYSDCDQIPMIKTITCWDKLPAFLDCTDELRNIYFTVTANDSN